MILTLTSVASILASINSKPHFWLVFGGSGLHFEPSAKLVTVVVSAVFCSKPDRGKTSV